MQALYKLIFAASMAAPTLVAGALALRLGIQPEIPKLRRRMRC